VIAIPNHEPTVQYFGGGDQTKTKEHGWGDGTNAGLPAHISAIIIHADSEDGFVPNDSAQIWDTICEIMMKK
jgi:hypothetical protein